MNLFANKSVYVIVLTIGVVSHPVHAKKIRMTGAEVLATYVGGCLKSSSANICYFKNGKYKDLKSGKSGRYSVSKRGILKLSGGYRMRLNVYKDGNRFYHQNVSSGAGGYYSLGSQ